MCDRTRNLAMIDELVARASPPLPDRPVVTDDFGRSIKLTIYRDRTVISEIGLMPQHSTLPLHISATWRETMPELPRDTEVVSSDSAGLVVPTKADNTLQHIGKSRDDRPPRGG